MSQRNERVRRAPITVRPKVTSTLRSAAWVSAAALIAIAITVGGSSIVEQNLQHWVHHSREVSRLSRAALTFALDAETADRGFLMTQDPRSLDRRAIAEPQLDAALDSVVAMTSDNPPQQATARDLQRAVANWRTEYTAGILAPTGRATHAGNSGVADQAAFDSVRSRANRLISAEDSLYTVRLDEHRRHHWIATGSVIAEVIVVLLALAWFVRQILNSARSIEEQHAELARQADALEEQASELEEQAAELETTNEELMQTAADAHAARAIAENEARQKARLAALFDAALGCSPTGFAFFDRELRFLRANPMMARIHGMAEEDLIGLPLEELNPQIAKDVNPLLRQVLETGTPVMNVAFRARETAAAEGPRDWLSSFFPIVLRDGETFGIGVVTTDVTDFKQLEEQLLQAQKMEAVGRLAGGVAHDFNNLLTVITSFAELILFDPGMERQKEEVQEIRGAAARAAKLTRQLLAFSRRQAMEPRIVNPNDVLRGVETLLRRLVVGNVDIITTDLSPDTPLIRVDPGQLEQVVMNLAINAADAMPDGGRLIIDTASEELSDEALKSEPELEAGMYAMIRVRDTGHGMDAATVAQIFEPFFTTKEPGRGTGLGLSTVYGIVKQSGGHVVVESAPGAGAVFTVYLPAVGESAEAVAF